VARYSPLSGYEADNLVGLTALLTEVIEPRIREFRGQMSNWSGERALIEFDSLVEAIRYAAILRDAVSQRNQTLPPERLLAVGIGINSGEIILEAGFGDGVNITARIHALAEPGVVYVSGIVHDQVADKVGYDFEDLGAHNLKNIVKPVRIFRPGGEVAKQLAALAKRGHYRGEPGGCPPLRPAIWSTRVSPIRRGGAGGRRRYLR
jgi:adenylate cyclase